MGYFIYKKHIGLLTRLLHVSPGAFNHISDVIEFLLFDVCVSEIRLFTYISCELILNIIALT